MNNYLKFFFKRNKEIMNSQLADILRTINDLPLNETDVKSFILNKYIETLTPYLEKAMDDFDFEMEKRRFYEQLSVQANNDSLLNLEQLNPKIIKSQSNKQPDQRYQI